MKCLAYLWVLLAYLAIIYEISMVGACLKPVDRYLGSLGPTNLSFNSNHVGKVQYSTSKRALTVQAGYRYQLSLHYDIQNEA